MWLNIKPDLYMLHSQNGIFLFFYNFYLQNNIADKLSIQNTLLNIVFVRTPNSILIRVYYIFKL